MSPREIKQARLELGLSRSQLAAILGTDTRRIRLLEAEAGPAARRVLPKSLSWPMLHLRFGVQ